MVIGAIKDDGPEGWIEFRNCTVENTGGAGVEIFDKSPEGARLRLMNCSWKDPHRTPILLHVRRVKLARMIGGIDFAHCAVYDTIDRPAIAVRQGEESEGVFDVRGRITVCNPHGARMELGPQVRGVTLKLLTFDRH